MITYEVRGTANFERVRIELEDKHRWSMNPNATLWQIERESESEAAVRRMNWIEEKFNNLNRDDVGVLTLKLAGSHLPLSSAIDSMCPPPAPKETQLDWNTGEPIKEVHTYLNNCGVWFASVNPFSLPMANEPLLLSVIKGKTTTGPTKEAATANLRAIHAFIKS